MTQFITPLVIRAYQPAELEDGEKEMWLLVEDLVVDGTFLGTVVIPKGFATDFASVPGLAKWFVDDDAKEILYPSVLHDWLYSRMGTLPDGRTYTREQADTALRDAMASCGASWFKRATVFRAVRIGGALHWN